MTIPEILKALEAYTGQFPREAVEAALDQREEITPELLRAIEAMAEDPAPYAARKDNMLPLFAFYLLAQFRERRAYSPMIKLLGAPGDTAYELLGDTVSEGLFRILASVYDGNPALLRGLVENPDADEFVRSAALHALLLLERLGQLPRAELVDYLRSLFHGRLERTTSYIWDALVGVVGDLPAPELLEEVRQAYAEGSADEGVANLKEIEQDMAEPPPWTQERYRLIEDVIEEMEDWACFQEDKFDDLYADGSDAPVEDDTAAPLAPMTYERPKPFVREIKTGRNDPCPCGSGKKYKKCCGSS